jgi:aminoglycoside phosphotransferase (APT) family kinase protein
MQTYGAIDPGDNHAVARALESYVQRSLGPGVKLAQSPTPLGQGFDTFIYTFRLSGDELRSKWRDDLVLRLYGSSDDAAKCAREGDVQRFVIERGYPAVEPLVHDGAPKDFGLPIMIMPRVPGGTLLDHAKLHPQRARKMLREMGRLHARLHQLSTADAPLPYDEPLVARILTESRDRMDIAQTSHSIDRMVEGYRWLADWQRALMSEEPVVCHNDFHPLNIMIGAGDGLMVIDWSNAALGDRHSDLGRTVTLFWFAMIAASSTPERIVLRALRGFLRRNYLRGYADALPFDRRRLQLWEAVHTFGGWAQLAELGARLAAGDGATKMEQKIPPSMIEAARDRFQYLRLQIENASP